MLLSVCLNPAIDVTYRLDTPVVPGHSHRVGSVHERAGGKGINVARVAQHLGLAGTVLAPIGGVTGAGIRAELDSGRTATGATSSVQSHLVQIAGTSRRTIAVVDPHDATLFNEPGPVLSSDEWSLLVASFETAVEQASLVVLSGSLPPGVPLDAYAQLTAVANARGRRVVVDAEGEPLQLALAARPYLVKPNLAELRTIVDGPLGTRSEIAAAGRELRRRGALNVVVSCGSDGLLAITEDGNWSAKSPSVKGNPTGAGDALVAALAVGTVRGDPWERRLRDGVAWSAAAVAAPLAGQIDPAVGAELRSAILVQRFPDHGEPLTTPADDASADRSADRSAADHLGHHLKEH